MTHSLLPLHIRPLRGKVMTLHSVTLDKVVLSKFLFILSIARVFFFLTCDVSAASAHLHHTALFPIVRPTTQDRPGRNSYSNTPDARGPLTVNSRQASKSKAQPEPVRVWYSWRICARGQPPPPPLEELLCVCECGVAWRPAVRIVPLSLAQE